MATQVSSEPAALPFRNEGSPAEAERASPILVSSHEEMNPSRRSSMEDCSVYAAPGTWDAPDEDMAYLGIYDGHGGKIAWVALHAMMKEPYIYPARIAYSIVSCQGEIWLNI